MISLLLAALTQSVYGQGGLLGRDDAQAGLTTGKVDIANVQAADKDDERCLAGAKDMIAVQACDAAEMKRQHDRLKIQYDALLKLPDVDRNAVIEGQRLWERYMQSTCALVGHWYRWPADMGKHQRTCAWRMTRLRADELQILVANASAALLPGR